MQRNLSKMLFEDNDPLKLYLEDFKASTTGNNIEPVKSKEDNKDDKEEDSDSEDEKEEKHYGYQGLGDEIRDVLDKHNESFFTLKSLLSEENASATTQSEEDESDNSGEDNDGEDNAGEDNAEKKKLGDELDIDDLIGEKSVSHANLLKVSDIILKRIKAAPAIAKMIKTFSKYDPESLDEEQEEFLKTYVKKLTKDNPEGMIDKASLKSFLTKPVNVAKVGKTIVNPMQTKSGRPQKVGVEPADLDFYKQFKIIPFFLNYEGEGGQLQTVSGHQGNSDYMVLFLAPAFGAVIENDMQLDLYSTLFPTFTSQAGLEKGHVIVDIDELPFVYIKDIDELKKAQTSFKTAINALASKAGSRKSDGKESEQDKNDLDDESSSEKRPEASESVFESFIYTGGISQLLNEENRSMDVLKFVNIAAPGKSSNEDDDEDEADQSGLTNKMADDFLIKDKACNVIKSTYTDYLEIQKSIYEKEKTEDAEKRADAIGSAIGSASSLASGTMKGFMAYGTVGSVIGTIGAGTAVSAGLTMLPFVLGASVALPVLDKSAQLGLRAFTGFSNLRRKSSLRNKSLDDQIEIVLKQQTENSGFQSIEDESEKLERVVIDVRERLGKEQQDPEKGVKKDSDDYYKITTKDFLKLCSKKMLAFTEISDISSDEEKQKVFRNFLIGSNKILNLVQVEIDEVAGMEIQEKIGQKDILQKDIDFDNKDVLKEVIDELREQIQRIQPVSVHQKAMKASILAALKMGNLEQATELIKELKEKPDNYVKRTSKYLEENEDASEEEAIEGAANLFGVDADSVKREMANTVLSKMSESQIKCITDIEDLFIKRLGVENYNSDTQKNIQNHENILVYEKLSDLKDEDKERGPTGAADVNNCINLKISIDNIKDDAGFLKNIDKKEFINYVQELFHELIINFLYDGKVNEFFEVVDSQAESIDKKSKNYDLTLKVLQFFMDLEGDIKSKIQDVTVESRKVYYKNSLSRLLFETSYSELNFNN